MYHCVHYNGSSYSEFDGDFTQFLLNIGVTKAHIDAVKSRIVIQYPYGVLDNYHRSALETRLVPTDKILWTGRSTEGLSFYDNVRIMVEGDREPNRFKPWLDKASKNLSDTLDTYQKLHNPVKMTYIKNEDLYYLSGDGNHRTLTAIVLGAKSILANIEGECELNHEKLEMYKLENDFYEKNNIHCVKPFNCSTTIGFYDNDKNIENTYFVHEFEKLNTDIPFPDMLKRLQKQIESDRIKYNLINKFPVFLSKFIQNHVICKKRIRYYFYKINLGEEDKYVKKDLYTYYWNTNHN